MKIVVNRFLPPKGFLAINLFGVLFVRKLYLSRVSSRVVNHERIHTAQMVETLFIFFYLLYSLEWLYWLIRRLFDRTINPYRSISFEREAYANDMDFTYLKRRKLFAAWRYYFRWKGDN
jgi:hypothetical protein